MNKSNSHINQRDDESDDDSVLSSDDEASVGNESGILPPEPASHEALAVKRSKRLVVLVLIAGAALVALVYLVAAGDEQQKFESDVQMFSDEVLEKAEGTVTYYASILQTLSTSMTSNAISSNLVWPNVSIPFFEIRAKEARLKSGMDVFMVAPLVSRAQQVGWEAYATQNQDWLGWGLHYQGLDDIPDVIPPTIHAFAGDPLQMVDNPSGPFAPVWHVGAAPTKASVVNMDLMSHKDIRRVMQRVLETGKAVMSPILDVEFLIQYSDKKAGLTDKSEGETDEDGDRRKTRRWLEAGSDGGIESVEANISFVVAETDNATEDVVSDPVEVVDADVEVNSMQEKDVGPRAIIVQPVFADFEKDSMVTGFVVAAFPLSRVLDNDEVIQDMDAVFSTSCGPVYTYRINTLAQLRGPSDLHEHRFNYLQLSEGFEPLGEEGEEGEESEDATRSRHRHLEQDDESECKYTLSVYPTSTLLFDEDNGYMTRYPMLYSFFVVLIISGTSFAFIVYDFMVRRHQRNVLQSAANAQAIVSSMFPATVQERILQNVEERERKKKDEKQSRANAPGNQNRVSHGEFGDETEGLLTPYSSKPIADLFTHTTIMFADIAGFTAWSSVREASQVFTLLETVYAAFDKVAKCLKVFKVETVGDCYVAVAGLPVPRNDHAMVMASFATKCLRRFEDLSKRLEVILGPGTGSLGLRVGLHSGPVTAGVLRGDNARFQLFGDTVNVASRMESTGVRGKIQVSSETAELLLKAGRKVTLREDQVEAKGKGLLQTYFLDLSRHRQSSIGTTYHGDEDETDNMDRESPTEAFSPHVLSPTSDEMDRLIEWNSNNLAELLRAVSARRSACRSLSKPGNLFLMKQPLGMVLEEVKEIIELPQFDVASVQQQVTKTQVHLKPEVLDEIRLYVSMIANQYRLNTFHNFEHASHVTMSVVKLLSRISNPPDPRRVTKTELMQYQHHLDTYGITSDPLTCFGCVFSALIHDVDHPGVPNAQLVAENGPLVKMYNAKSVAEQNSVDIAWNLLMEDRFANFRAAIFADEPEKKRFRQILVNSVMATDLMDQDLKQLRNSRWNKAFQKDVPVVGSGAENATEESLNRKATIVIEHLIQASDVAHTMQHWHIYRKWNERLYQEMYQAFRDGRSSTDPTDGWYQGEIGFFDFYIIPLAKKLADCGVFGVSSFEYLNFATRNRDEWIAKGKDIVIAMRRTVEASITPRMIEV